MTNKKLFIGFAVLLVVGIILIIIYNNVKTESCVPFVGGSFTLKYEGVENAEDVTVCIACSPSSYEDLLVPTKEGYTFDGWYYNEELTDKVDGTSTIDIQPLAEYDENNCQIGYQTITIYAKWK